MPCSYEKSVSQGRAVTTAGLQVACLWSGLFCCPVPARSQAQAPPGNGGDRETGGPAAPGGSTAYPPVWGPQGFPTSLRLSSQSPPPISSCFCILCTSQMREKRGHSCLRLNWSRGLRTGGWPRPTPPTSCSRASYSSTRVRGPWPLPGNKAGINKRPSSLP